MKKEKNQEKRLISLGELQECKNIFVEVVRGGSTTSSCPDLEFDARFRNNHYIQFPYDVYTHNAYDKEKDTLSIFVIHKNYEEYKIKLIGSVVEVIDKDILRFKVSEIHMEHRDNSTLSNERAIHLLCGL